MENIYNNDPHVTKLIKWSIYHDIEMLFKSVRILFVNGDNCNFQLVLCTNVPKVRSIRVYHIPFVHQNNSSLLLYTVKIILLEIFKWSETKINDSRVKLPALLKNPWVLV